jgi:hypothetical protein
MWEDMLEKEKITDIIISDIIVTSEIREEIEKVKDEFCIRNVIYMHSLMGGPSVGPAELAFNEINYHQLRLTPGTVFLNELLNKYEDTPVKYDKSMGGRPAFITHTSESAKGLRQPQSFTDKEFNDTLSMFPKGPRSFMKSRDDGKPIMVLQSFDYSSIMTLSGQLCSSLANGETVITTYFGFMHPKFIRAIDYYDVDILMTSGFILDKWLERKDLNDIDLSSLKAVLLSEDWVEPEKMAAYSEFFEKHAYKYGITAPDDTFEVGMHNNSAYSLFELLNTAGASKDDGADIFDMFMPWKMFMHHRRAKEAFRMPEIPENVRKTVLKYGNRLSGLSNGRRWIDHDFEE